MLRMDSNLLSQYFLSSGVFSACEIVFINEFDAMGPDLRKLVTILILVYHKIAGMANFTNYA